MSAILILFMDLKTNLLVILNQKIGRNGGLDTPVLKRMIIVCVVSIPYDEWCEYLLLPVRGRHMQAVARLPVRSLALTLPLHCHNTAGRVDSEGN
jgi:hypothetical protein